MDEFYASFDSIDVGPSAARLSKSGFRFIGPGANEKCVYCEGGFRSRFWNDNGNLLSRKRWYRLIQYTHLFKGGYFIKEFFSHIEKVIKRLQSAPEGEHNTCPKLTAAKITIQDKKITFHSSLLIMVGVVFMQVPRQGHFP